MTAVYPEDGIPYVPEGVAVFKNSEGRCAAYCKFGKFVLIMADQKKKQIPLRLSAKLYDAVAAWAEDDFRSVNGQIEYLLTECVRQRKKNGKYVSEHLDEHPEFDIK